jgi:hypothetical protein
MWSDLNVGYVTVSTDGAQVADRALIEKHFTFKRMQAVTFCRSMLLDFDVLSNGS